MSMVSCSAFFIALISVAGVHGAKLGTSDNTEIVSNEREGRILEIPLLALLVWKVSKIGWFVVSKILGFIGWKVAAVTLAATVALNVGFWVYENCLSLAIGAIAMLGFCKVTGKCSLHHIPSNLIEVGENLYYAARNLDSGIQLYDNVDK